MVRRFPLHVSTWVMTLLGALLAALACPASESAPPRPAPDPRPAFRSATVYVQSPQGEVSVRVEVAETEAQRMHGLMFKETLAEDEGMVFLFDRTEEHIFWMKNTPLPLDMAFLGEDRKVVGVYENAEPLSLARMSVGLPSRYVLEVRGGWFRAHGAGRGTQVRFSGVE